MKPSVVLKRSRAPTTGFDILAEPELKNDRSLEHPWNRPPELCQESPPARRCFLGDSIGTEFTKPPTSFNARQTRWRCSRF
jgi:hypothetical protein